MISTGVPRIHLTPDPMSLIITARWISIHPSAIATARLTRIEIEIVIAEPNSAPISEMIRRPRQIHSATAPTVSAVPEIAIPN